MKKNIVNAGLKVDGLFRDIIINKRTGEVKASKWEHNIVVNSAINLITALLAGKNTKGIKYWAVGSGANSWDTKPVDPTASETKLTSEIGRKSISTIEFYNSNNGISTTPTNKIHIAVTFNENECNGAWREFGLFGGDTASSTADSGIMIDKKHHSIITKTQDIVIERHIILTFNLA